MHSSLSRAALAVALLAAPFAQAETVTGSSTDPGDLCLTDANPEGDFDCATISGNIGIHGVYNFVLSGLDPNPTGDATFRLTSTDADVFSNEADNNAGERFRLVIDGVDFGLLFDSSEFDEARVSPSLAASVQDNIAHATGSTGPIDLSFTLPLAQFAPMIADGQLIVRLDFREDQNINRFFDPTVSVSYPVGTSPLAVMPEAPAADLAALVAAIAAQTAAIEHLTAAIQAMPEH